MEAVAVGISAGRKCCNSPCNRTVSYKTFTLLFTFCIYTTYHLSRKPISVVKSILHSDLNCTEQSTHNVSSQNASLPEQNVTKINCGWPPFDTSHGDAYLGALDASFLFPYAVGMFISGHIAERVSLRYFLTGGMLLTGATTVLVGMAFYWNIHSLAYFIVMQVLAGLFQATGWPCVVTCVANWFGKGKRGLIMGLWNSHTSVGNILGSVIAGYFADTNWGLSFIVPGAIIAGMGVLVFFLLVPKPDIVGCEMPAQEAAPTTQREDDEAEIPGSASIQDEPDYDHSELLIENSIVKEEEPLLSDEERHPGSRDAHAISFLGALKIPGVIEFSLCLFFAKLVSYTFLFWLPDYIKATNPTLTAAKSADMSTLFDFGGIVGGIIAGVISDVTGGRATTCMVMLLLGGPMLFVYRTFAAVSMTTNIALLLVCGFFVNGPYALITTAVSADLGTHSSLHGNSRALATVTAIIDGTGSIGAALGPQMAGVLSGNWNNVFYMLIAADACAMLLICRLVLKELRTWCCRRNRNAEVLYVDQ